MAQSILFESDFLILSYDYVEQWLYASWNGLQTAQTVDEGCTQILQQLRQERCTKLLNDNSTITEAWSNTSDWGQHWAELLADAGLEYLAWVYSPNFYNRRSTDEAASRSMRPLMLTFEDVATAKAWLRQM